MSNSIKVINNNKVKQTNNLFEAKILNNNNSLNNSSENNKEINIQKAT